MEIEFRKWDIKTQEQNTYLNPHKFKMRIIKKLLIAQICVSASLSSEKVIELFPFPIVSTVVKEIQRFDANIPSFAVECIDLHDHH